MAKVSAHGTEIGTINYKSKSKRYMSDGAVLINLGFGWKIHSKCKSGVSPVQAFEAAKARQVEFLTARPAFAAYVKELHAMAGLCNRWKLNAAVERMPEDCDGVWSEACDGYGDNVHADIDEVGNLCRLYLNALAEMKFSKRRGVKNE